MSRKRDPVPWDQSDPTTLAAMLGQYQLWMTPRFSQATVKVRYDQVRPFLLWAAERSVWRPQEVTRAMLEAYQRHLMHHRKSSGEPLSVQTRSMRISALKSFFSWLTKQNHLLFNPASELELPRIGRQLPRHVLTLAEVEAVLSVPDLEDPMGVRDRAILEVLFSTGIRRQELIELECDCVDPERMVVMVRQGKGRKDRVVPIGERALVWLGKYLEEVRPGLVRALDPGFVFLMQNGRKLTVTPLGRRVRRYVKESGIGKTGGCHLFRHSMATLMHENGCDIRLLQAILGHTDLNTTQVYTHLSISRLREAHAATHPAAKLRRGKNDQPELDAGASATGDDDRRGGD
jgi:integrase/recombinase XerD